MAQQFDGYTDQQADAIHQTIKVYLKPDIRWDSLLDEITDQIRPICNHAEVLYTGDIQRRLKTLETALEAVLSDHDQLGGPLQWHLQRQVFDYLPSLDEETGPTLSCIMNAALRAVRQAKRRPFDHPHAFGQKRGAPTNHAIVLLVNHLLYVFEDATSIQPTVYAWSHAKDGEEADKRSDYKGTAYPFLLACLAPLMLLPSKTRLPSAILAAYRQAKPIRLGMKEDAAAAARQDRALADQWNAWTQGSKPQQDSQK